ncbi:MAG: DUF87 domain-containing protein [Haloferacaceae archaeon]
MHVLGRDGDRTDRPTARLGRFRARDGSHGGVVGFDLDGPHVGLVVGKRGSGKSYTLGVLAEALADANGVSPIVVDPMGVFGGLARDTDGVPARETGSAHPLDAEPALVTDPRVRADAIPPRPELFGIEPSSPTGSLLWRVAEVRSTLAEMMEALGESREVASLEARQETRRAVRNHLKLADSWGVFDPDGLHPGDLLTAGGAVLDLAGTSRTALGVVVRAVASGLYDACVDATPARLPWLLLDEAHFAFEGIAGPALRTLLTRGRSPGVSLIAATQRPGTLPPVAVSQADLVVAHELTAESDIDSLAGATPTYVDGEIRDRLPRRTGTALVVDDATKGAHTVQIRERRTAHGGESPRASARRSPVAKGPTATGESGAYVDQ